MMKTHLARSKASRRDVLGGLAAASAMLVSPSQSWARDFADLHDTVARKAATLAQGTSKTLRLLMPNGSGDNVRPVIAAFARATGITIEAIESPVDAINTQLSLDMMSGDSNYDLALPATFGLPDLAAEGAIMPLNTFAARHEPDGFRSGTLYQIGDSFDDKLYGFQTDGDTYLMFYHKELLENADEQARYADLHGTALGVPGTWAELDRQMAFFNRPDKGLYGGSLFRVPGYLAWEWWVRFHAKGLWPLSADLEPQINGDAGVEALEDLIRATEHQVPEVNGNGLFDNWKRYAKGDIYANIGWGGTQKFLNGPTSAMRNRMVFGPTPGGIIDNELLLTPYFNWGWNYVVTSNSKNPELAYLFALFASTPEMSTVSVRQQGGYFDPFRPEHYQDAKIAEAYSPEFLVAHEASLRASIPDLYLAGQGEFFRSLSDWLDRALTGNVTPKDALDRVAQQWRLINRRAGMRQQKERWAQLRGKYPAKVRAILRDLT